MSKEAFVNRCKEIQAIYKNFKDISFKGAFMVGYKYIEYGVEDVNNELVFYSKGIKEDEIIYSSLDTIMGIIKENIELTRELYE